MAPSQEKSTFGATVTPMAQTNLDSPALTPATTRTADFDTFLEKPIPPHSPFYQHPPASFERVASNTLQPSKLLTTTTITPHDLESGLASPTLSSYTTRSSADSSSSTHHNHNAHDNPFTSTISIDHTGTKECKMWPSRKTLLETKLAEKKRRHAQKGFSGCAPVRDFWARFDKRHKLLIKILIALLVVGLIVGVSVGVTKAVDGNVYASDGLSHPVGSAS